MLRRTFPLFLSQPSCSLLSRKGLGSTCVHALPFPPHFSRLSSSRGTLQLLTPLTLFLEPGSTPRDTSRRVAPQHIHNTPTINRTSRILYTNCGNA